MDATKERTIEHLVNLLGTDKDKFIEKLKNRIKERVSGLGKECVTVIKKDYPDKGVYKFSADSLPTWAKHLYLFCRDKDGASYDSPVTRAVIDEVTKCFEEYYISYSNEISTSVANSLSSNKVFVDTLTKSIGETAIANGVRGAAKNILLSSIKTIIIETLKSAQVKAITANVAGIVKIIVAKMTAMGVGKVILKQLVMYLKVAIAKILASTAAKTIIAAAVKKFAAVAIVGVVANAVWGLFGAKLAAFIGGAFVPILIGGILAWVAYDIIRLPHKLADKLSKEIPGVISPLFGDVNKTVITNIYEQIGGNSAELAYSIAKDEAVVDAFKAFSKDIASMSS